VRFSETTKLTAPELVISRRHEEWVTQNDAHPTYTAEALDFAHTALSKPDRVRKGTLSASSLGRCDREQQFVYLGLPKVPPEAKAAMRMQNGSFMHLRWQMEGLSEGWLMAAEVPLIKNPYLLLGTMDGLLYDGSVLELKSINANGFSRVATFGPLLPHLFQMATYVLCTGRNRGVFLYENKDTQEYQEIVVGPHDLPLADVEAKAMALWSAIEGQELKEPLEKCIDQEGWVYHSCPYRDRCLSIHRWEEARERVH
jgi:hypothetical protein